MAFDKNLDKSLFSETVEFEMGKLTVGVFSYNEGESKLQISREIRNPNSGEFQWSKLGRMTKPEVEAVLPLMQKAVEFMKS